MIKLEKYIVCRYNIFMKKDTIHSFVLIIILSFTAAQAEIIPLQNLNYDDDNYNILSNATITSKNRMIKGIRKEEYTTLDIYRYTVKVHEDIWTIIAKTSLNIDTIATLNRYDFIGMVQEGKKVFLPDTLGIFFDSNTYEKHELAVRYSVKEEDILLIEDPLNKENTLYFLPETELSFLERTYIRGVVFHAPLMGVQTSGYGERIDPFVNEMTFHGGVDISSKEGKVVRASRGGKIFYADVSNGYGNLVILQHELGYYTLYGHLQEISVEKDEIVETGQAIGKVGMTGRTTGPHLHFEIRRYNQQLNPENIPLFLEHKADMQ